MLDFEIDSIVSDDLTPVYGSYDRVYRIDSEASQRQIEQVFNEETVEGILMEGMSLVVAAARQVLLNEAQRSTGLLAQSIMAAAGDHFSSGIITVFLAWRKIKVNRSEKVSRSSNTTYVDQNGVVKHYHGYGVRSKGKRAAGSYIDSNGKLRHVRTTADYGGILEYSESRKLRHMSVGYEKAEQQAVALMDRKFSALSAELEKVAFSDNSYDATVAL